ncbi:DUF4352 domain-containing protein [Corynebacterium frankenforstense]|uniref:DUF4352 domain-containing protein n=2 Tax=Corynebacterium frankenforstense TaxID=1230998 RepID=UPI0012EBA7AA|nr:DUF4352 domain-containing protein [Corynebacterium frankenforstense]
MKRLLLALAAVASLTLAGCGGGGGSDAPAESETESSAPAGHSVGEMVEAEGVALRVDAVTETDKIELLSDHSTADPNVTEKVREGGKYVVVDTTVRNDDTQDMDLTCGFAVQAKLVTEPAAEYGPEDSLYRVPGNPECNDNLGPGFDTTMTWVFVVPKDRKVTALGFANPEYSFDDLTYISIDGIDSERPKGKGPHPTTGADAADSDAGAESSASTAAPAAEENDGNAGGSDNATGAAAGGAPAYGAGCSASQAGMPARDGSGEPLVCAFMGGSKYTWVYGPEPQGAGTAEVGGECVDGEQGGQDAAGHVLICSGGQWYPGP